MNEKLYRVQMNSKGAPDFSTAVEVSDRPQGKWFVCEYEYFTCDQCGEDVESYAEYTQEAKNMLENGEYPNFCPNCGAKMRIDNE